MNIWLLFFVLSCLYPVKIINKQVLFCFLLLQSFLKHILPCFHSHFTCIIYWIFILHMQESRRYPNYHFMDHCSYNSSGLVIKVDYMEEQRDRTVNDLIIGNIFIPWVDLQNKFGLMHFLEYVQLRSLEPYFDLHSFGKDWETNNNWQKSYSVHTLVKSTKHHWNHGLSRGNISWAKLEFNDIMAQ